MQTLGKGTKFVFKKYLGEKRCIFSGGYIDICIRFCHESARKIMKGKLNRLQPGDLVSSFISESSHYFHWLMLKPQPIARCAPNFDGKCNFAILCSSRSALPSSGWEQMIHHRSIGFLGWSPPLAGLV